MGFINKIFGEKTPEEKEAKRRNKFLKNEAKINERIGELKPEFKKGPQKLMFTTDLSKNVKLAKTKEEYVICANQFKDWFDISLKFYNMDLSFSKELSWGLQTQMEYSQWNNFLETLTEGFKALAISGQYDELLDYNNVYYDEFIQILARMKIHLPYNVKVGLIKLETVNSIISLYAAFSLYKLGMFDESRRLFNETPNFKINFENDEGDYEREVFEEYNNEINPRDFIRLMNQGNLIECPNCGKKINERAIRCKYCKTTLKSGDDANAGESNIDAEATAKEIMDLKSEMANLKDDQDRLKDIAFNDEDIMRRSVAIIYITDEETLLEIINDENEDEMLRGIAVTNEHLSYETLDDIIKNNPNQHIRQMAETSLNLRKNNG